MCREVSTYLLVVMSYIGRYDNEPSTPVVFFLVLVLLGGRVPTVSESRGQN